MDPTIPWEEWSDIFQLAVIAKENLDKEKRLNPIERHQPKPHILEKPQDSELETQKTAHSDRYFQMQKIGINEGRNEQFNGMRIEEADKKLQSIL